MTQATETMSRLYQAFATGDGEALAAIIGDSEWVEAAGGPYGGSYRGLPQIMENVFGPIARDVDGFTAIPDEIVPMGDDRAIALGYYGGRADTGPIEIRFAHIATVEGERITHFEQLTDTHQWRAALGQD